MKYGHYFLWDGALKINYRYYWDDWGIKGHTIEVIYDQRLVTDWIVSPHVRLYTQTPASFFGNQFPAPQTYMSADYRLSPLDSVLGGLTITADPRPGSSAWARRTNTSTAATGSRRSRPRRRRGWPPPPRRPT